MIKMLMMMENDDKSRKIKMENTREGNKMVGTFTKKSEE
jgi:hypothetical protein